MRRRSGSVEVSIKTTLKVHREVVQEMLLVLWEHSERSPRLELRQLVNSGVRAVLTGIVSSKVVKIVKERLSINCDNC